MKLLRLSLVPKWRSIKPLQGHVGSDILNAVTIWCLLL